MQLPRDQWGFFQRQLSRQDRRRRTNRHGHRGRPAVGRRAAEQIMKAPRCCDENGETLSAETHDLCCRAARRQAGVPLIPLFMTSLADFLRPGRGVLAADWGKCRCKRAVGLNYPLSPLQGCAHTSAYTLSVCMSAVCARALRSDT